MNNRRYLYFRNRYRNPLQELYSRVRLAKRSEYNIRNASDIDNLQICESGYTKGQGWGGLYKSWQGFLINRNLDDREKMNYYAQGIRKIEKDMKIDLSKFPDLRMEALAYATDPDNVEIIEEEAANLNKDSDELTCNEILGIMLNQDEKAYQRR